MTTDPLKACELASAALTAPTSSSYWVVPGLLLAGAYPGAKDPEERLVRVKVLLDAGIRNFVSLMEVDETNHDGERFVPYENVAREVCPGVSCFRHPIQDLSIPSRAEMKAILTAIDASVAAQSPAYVHCWGGVGRTGTVIGCWLLRHGLADPATVLKVLMELRQQDRDRRHRMSPETPEQQQFVKRWLAK
ncbi:MAG: protein-tyrosine phosphatase family protein [Thermoguttaceae bacterium]